METTWQFKNITGKTSQIARKMEQYDIKICFISKMFKRGFKGKVNFHTVWFVSTDLESLSPVVSFDWQNTLRTGKYFN